MVLSPGAIWVRGTPLWSVPALVHAIDILYVYDYAYTPPPHIIPAPEGAGHPLKKGILGIWLYLFVSNLRNYRGLVDYDYL